MKPLTHREKKLLTILRDAVASGRPEPWTEGLHAEEGRDYARLRRRLLVELRRSPHCRRETP